MLSPLPRRSGWACCFAHSPQPYQPSPITLSGRPAHCPFRGLLGVHSRYGLHTRAVTVYRDTLIEGFSHFVTSMTAPIASGWSGCRVGLAPTGKRRLFTAHGQSGLAIEARAALMTHLYGPAARCKPKMMIWGRLVLRICIRPIDGACELLAIMDIRARSISFTSRPRGPYGSPDHERAGETFSPSPLSDSQTSAGNQHLLSGLA